MSDLSMPRYVGWPTRLRTNWHRQVLCHGSIASSIMTGGGEYEEINERFSPQIVGKRVGKPTYLSDC